MRLPRAFSIINFRVSLLSAGIFAVVAILLFVAMDWAITDYMEELVDQSIETQLSDLRDNGLLPAAPRQDFDVERLVHWLNQRQALAPSHLFHYMLRDPDGKAVTGAVEGARLVPGWQNIPLPNFHDPYDGDEHSLRGWGERLPNGYLLFIGRDIHEIDELLDRIEIAFGAVLLTILVLSLVSSFFVSQWFLIRLDRINATCRAIMAGDLSRRIEQEPGDDDFSRLSINLNSMLDRIHGLMEGMQQISNDIAHDMRTPLTRLRHSLERAGRQGASLAECQQAVHKAEEEAERVLDTFSALLRIAQISSSHRRNGFQCLDLGEIVSLIAETYAPVVEDAGGTLTIEEEAAVPFVGDRHLLTQMLANLVENAIKYAGPTPSVMLSLRQRKGGFSMSVADHGPGVPAEFRDKIMRRFYRMDSSRSTPGNGLGLSLVAAVADLHGLQIRLEDNQPGLRVVLSGELTQENGLVR